MKSYTYVGATQHNFQNALIGCLEADYALVGSRKILEIMAQDIQKLVDEFYPSLTHLSDGWMVYTGTKANKRKVYPGKRAGEFELVTIAWPVLTPEDIQRRCQMSDGKSHYQQWLLPRLIRIIEHGLSHPKGPVLLTLADLALMLGSTAREICTILKLAREQSGRKLPTKGHFFDIGMKPTHKAEIVALYEQGLDEAAIAKKMNHDQRSVGKYLRDYDRVKSALKKGIPLHDIPRLLGLLSSVVQTYAQMVQKYHPNIEIDVKDRKFY